jgi:hypothetical protein
LEFGMQRNFFRMKGRFPADLSRHTFPLKADLVTGYLGSLADGAFGIAS